MPQRGLTLIELLVSVAILSIVAAVTIPAFGRAVDSVRFKAAARELASALRATRLYARTTQKDAALIVDTESLHYTFPGGEGNLHVPDGTALSIIVAERERLNATAGGIRFFTDGSSTGGTLRLERSSKNLTLEVSWLTGHARFVDQNL